MGDSTAHETTLPFRLGADVTRHPLGVNNGGTPVEMVPPGTGLLMSAPPTEHASFSATDRYAGARRCATCREWKSLDAFVRSASGQSGRMYYCVPCWNSMQRARRSVMERGR